MATPTPLPGVGYFAPKSIILFGLRDGSACKIFHRKGLRTKYLESWGYGCEDDKAPTASVEASCSVSIVSDGIG
jgi:hypothetical protein